MTRLLVLAAALVAAGPARAFEAAPTHAAMTEAAAWPSKLVDALRRWGRARGPYEPLALRLEAEAGARQDRVAVARLRRRLEQLDPGAGYAPAGERATLAAIGWLVAGAVLEEIPSSRGRHHFLDPVDGRGLDDARPGASLLMNVLGAVDVGGTFAGLFTGGNFDLTGMPADRWIVSPENEQSYEVFLAELRRSAVAGTPEARDDALARGLLALGGVLHVLQDMASPSHARNDFRVAHLASAGWPSASALDRGPAFERWVALAYGPTAPEVGGGELSRVRLRDFFRAQDGKGLADFTARNFFSPGTLPRAAALRAGLSPPEIVARLDAQLARPEPRIAALSRGAKAAYARGIVPHLARHRVDASGRLAWSLDAECHADYARVLVREAVRASRDLIAFALRGRLDVRAEGGGLRIANAGVALAHGRLSILAESADGRRVPLGDVVPRLPAPRAAELALAAPAVPDGTRRLVVVFDGEDGWGEPLVIIETLGL